MRCACSCLARCTLIPPSERRRPSERSAWACRGEGGGQGSAGGGGLWRAVWLPVLGRGVAGPDSQPGAPRAAACITLTSGGPSGGVAPHAHLGEYFVDPSQHCLCFLHSLPQNCTFQ